jgi:adenylosuccinate synthase
VLGAGALLDLSILVEEIEALNGMWGHSNQPILVDRHATFITEEDKHYEAFLTGRIGSTGKGVGAAQSRKVMRTSVAAENPNIQDKLTDLFGGQVQVVDTTAYLNSSPDVDHFAHLVEGTQGYLLSLDVGGYYPFCTSRNCGPEAIMSQLGINPRSYRANQIIGVFRTFPIRVGGNSGDLPGEVTWEEMEQITEGVVKADNPEITTVTKKPRRIARRDQEMTAKTIRDTRPDEVALTFLDYVRPEECRFVQDDAEMMEKIRDGSLDIVELPIGIIEEVSKFEGENGVYVGMISVGQHLTIKL